MPNPLPHAADIMAKQLVTVQPETCSYDAIVLLLKHEISGMPVVDEQGKLVGILSERDCLKTLVEARYHESPAALVRELMSTSVETVGPESDIFEIARFFLNNRYRRLPVVEGDRLLGQISRRDVLRAMEEMR